MKKYLLLILALSVYQLANASAYWLELKGNNQLHKEFTIQLCYGSMDERGHRQRDTGKELQLTGDFKMRLVDPQGKQVSLVLTKARDCWEATFTPESEGDYRIIAFNDKHPVIDRSATGGENVRPVDYLCASYRAGKSSASDNKPMQRLDITTVNTGDLITVEVFQNQQLVKAGTKLRVFNPDNWEKELIVDSNGEAKLYPTIKGLYIIRMDWIEPKAGEVDGVKYQRTRHRCNYYLMID